MGGGGGRGEFSWVGQIRFNVSRVKEYCQEGISGFKTAIAAEHIIKKLQTLV